MPEEQNANASEELEEVLNQLNDQQVKVINKNITILANQIKRLADAVEMSKSLNSGRSFHLMKAREIMDSMISETDESIDAEEAPAPESA